MYLEEGEVAALLQEAAGGQMGALRGEKAHADWLSCTQMRLVFLDQHVAAFLNQTNGSDTSRAA